MRISAKYSGRCHACSSLVGRGDSCYFNPYGRRGQRIRCAQCGEFSAYTARSSPAFVRSPMASSAGIAKPKKQSTAGPGWASAIGVLAFIGLVIVLANSPTRRSSYRTSSYGSRSYRTPSYEVSTPGTISPPRRSVPTAKIDISSTLKALPRRTTEPQLTIVNDPVIGQWFVEENGSYFGELNQHGIPKTVDVYEYFRHNGTYVRGYFRSLPSSYGGRRLRIPFFVVDPLELRLFPVFVRLGCPQHYIAIPTLSDQHVILLKPIAHQGSGLH